MINAHFRIEDLGDRLKVEINGSGHDLVNLLSSLMDQEPKVRELIEVSLLTVMSEQMKQSNDEKSLMDMLSKMKIGLS